MIKFIKTKELEAVGDKYGCLDCPYFYEPDCPIDEDGAIVCIGGYFREVTDEETIQKLVLDGEPKDLAQALNEHMRPKPTPNPKPNQHEKEIELLDRFAIAYIPHIEKVNHKSMAETAYHFAIEMIKIRKEVIKTLDLG
jgi:hypothetical protein